MKFLVTYPSRIAWDRNGIPLWYHRKERSRFPSPTSSILSCELSFPLLRTSKQHGKQIQDDLGFLKDSLYEHPLDKVAQKWSFFQVKKLRWTVFVILGNNQHPGIIPILTIGSVSVCSAEPPPPPSPPMKSYRKGATPKQHT